MKGKPLVTMVVMAVTALLLVAAVRAQGSEPTAVVSQQELLEWDGTTLTSRAVPVASEEERALLEKWNAMTAAQAELQEQALRGQLKQPYTIETDQGIVTVSKSVDEGYTDPLTAEPTSVEVEYIETPYGTVTVTTVSYGELVDESP